VRPLNELKEHLSEIQTAKFVSVGHTMRLPAILMVELEETLPKRGYRYAIDAADSNLLYSSDDHSTLIKDNVNDSTVDKGHIVAVVK
jgi:hypothetical protein